MSLPNHICSVIGPCSKLLLLLMGQCQHMQYHCEISCHAFCLLLSFSQTETMWGERRPYYKCTGRQVKYPPLVPLKLRHHKVSQMAGDKWHGGSCLHPFQSGQQIWKVFLCKHKPHVRSEGRAKLQMPSRRKMWKATRGQRFFLAQITDYLASAQPLTPQPCTADTRNGKDGQAQKSKIKTPFETQNPKSWAGPCEAIPFSKTRWLTLDEYCTPERPWLKVKMRPDGIYVTESEGGVGVASHWPWSNKGQGEKIAGCETEPSRSQQVAELWLQPQIQFCSWGLKVDGGSFLPRKS